MAVTKKTCVKCGRSQNEKSCYWINPKEGKRWNVCKDCATKYVDNKKPDTFLWVLEEFDMPFIEEIWVGICKKLYVRDPVRFSNKSVLGSYIRTMAMSQYQGLHYADSQRLNEERIAKRKRAEESDRKAREEAEKRIAEGKGSIENEDIWDEIPEALTEEESKNFLAAQIKEKEERDGKISKRKLDRLVHADKDFSMNGIPEPIKANPVPAGVVDVTQNAIDEKAIYDNLTQEDIQYLAMTWGENYRPSEWLKMEEMYRKYCSEYEINTDRENALRAMCKTNVKMEQALDSGDAASASKFSTMFDQLRKSAAFTEAQKKEEKEKYLDSVGELVREVESIGDIIPRFDIAFEAPDDKVDLTLKDMKAYNYNLIKNEMGLGDIIETYIKRLEESQVEQTIDMGDLQTEDEDGDAEADAYLKSLEQSIGQDVDAIFSKIGDE